MPEGYEAQNERPRRTGLVPLPRVYVDESGQTGEDLLSLEQPIFSLGSVHLDDDVASGILINAGLGERRDWKFRKLRGSGSGRRAILAVLRALTPSTAKFALVHKRYMLVAKLVDQLLEPVLRRAGVDLYDRSGQVAIASAGFFALPVALGEARVEVFYSAFMKMHRTRSIETIDAFFNVLKDAVKVAPAPIADDLRALLDARDDAQLMLLGESALEPNEIDPQITMPTALFHGWGQEIGTPFEVIHDHAAVVEAWLPQFEPFLFSDMPKRTIGYGERAFTLPLLVAKVRFGDSGESPQLQIADIVAGSTAFLFTGLVQESDDPRFHRELSKLDLLPMLTLAVWPDRQPDLDEKDARAAGQRDPATETAAFLREWRERGA